MAIVPGARVDARSAIESLQMGFVPIASGTFFKKADEVDFDLNFLTSRVEDGDAPIDCPELNLRLQPLRFMEFSMEDTLQSALIGNTGSVLVNIPTPARYAVHKLLICTERQQAQAGRARQDVLQAAMLIDYFRDNDPESLAEAWADAVSRAPAWRKALASGVKKLLQERPAMRGVVDTSGLLDHQAPNHADERPTG